MPTAAPAHATPKVLEVALARRQDSVWNEARREGRRLFHASRDSRISRRGASCAGCHPDGRDDGLTWRNMATLSLAGRLARSGPFGWRREHKTLAERVQSTARELLGRGFGRHGDKASREHLIGYLRHMRPPPPPLPHSAAMAAGIKRGETVFSDTLSCSACHPKGEGSASKFGPDESNGDFDFRLSSPSLRDVGIAAPYFHDNRYATLEALLSDPKAEMDNTPSLSEGQRGDLIAYLRALPHGVVAALPKMTANNVFKAHVPSSPAWGQQWQPVTQPTPRTEVLSKAPGRQLLTAPQRFDIDDIPTFQLASESDKLVGSAWLSGRDRAGKVLVPGDRYRMAYLDSNRSDGHAVPHFILSQHGGLRLEVQRCPLAALAQLAGMDGDFLFPVRCPSETQPLPIIQLGAFGFAARTRHKGEEVLWVIAPQDVVWDHVGSAGERYSVGPVERDFREGDYEWLSLHYLPLRPGAAAMLVRLDNAHPQNWFKSGLPKLPSKAVLSVAWPQGAAKPTILVGGM